MLNSRALVPEIQSRTQSGFDYMMESQAGVSRKTSTPSNEDQLLAPSIVLTQVPQTRSAVPKSINKELDGRDKSASTNGSA
ncbi:hypothetical protein ECG_09655 [Echinococcus granulosus]|nr:hypothetical protein ECG_09655 [Echinococcus granulosus]